MSILSELYDRQGRIATEMRALVEKATAEKRGLTADEETTWQNASKDLEIVEGMIERAKKVDGIDEQLYKTVRKYNDENGNHPGRPNPGQQPQSRESQMPGAVRAYFRADKEVRGQRLCAEPRAVDSDSYITAFRSLIRNGEAMTSPELRAVLAEHRAAQTSTTTGGGYTIPTGMRADIEIAMAAYGGLRSVATIWRTDSGNPIDWPSVNDTATTGRLLSENSAETSTAATFATVQFNAYKYTSDTILVPIELAQDTGINLESVVARLLAERLGRITAEDYVTGSGSSKPKGITVAATNGRNAGGAASSNLTMVDVTELIHSVDPVYRVGPGVGFLFNDAVFKVLKLLKDDTGGSGLGRPLWQPAIADAVPATIDGYRYYIDQNMPTFLENSPNGGERVMVFGDLSKYMIRDSLDMTLTVLRELYAGNHQIGYVAIMRTDGDLLDAGTRPVKYMAMSA